MLSVNVIASLITKETILKSAQGMVILDGDINNIIRVKDRFRKNNRNTTVKHDQHA